MGKIKKRRPVKVDPKWGISMNHDMAKWRERQVLEYKLNPANKARRDLFLNFYPARLGVFKGLYRKYNLPEETLKKIVDDTFTELLLKYRPRNEKSLFVGFIHLCFLHYCLSNLRKYLQGWRQKQIRRLDKKNFAKNTIIPIKTFTNLMKEAKLTKRQTAILQAYFVLRHNFVGIGHDLGISPSTVRNTKRAALLKIQQVNPSSYKKLTVRRTLSPILNAFTRSTPLKYVETPPIFLNEHTRRVIQEKRLLEQTKK